MKLNKDAIVSKNLEYHLTNNIDLDNCIFRYGSIAWCSLIVEARKLYKDGLIEELSEEEYLLLESNTGEEALYEGVFVVLDTPIPDWKNIQDDTVISSYIVFTKDKNNNVIKVPFDNLLE